MYYCKNRLFVTHKINDTNFNENKIKPKIAPGQVQVACLSKYQYGPMLNTLRLVRLVNETRSH